MKKNEQANLNVNVIASNLQGIKDIDYNPQQYAAIYARQSNLKEKYSLDTQIAACKRKLQKENLILYQVYSDKVSGRIEFHKRKEFKKLLNDLYAGIFKTIIVARRDRLTRDIKDFFKIRNILKQHNIRIIYASEGEFDNANRSYISNFIENVLMAISTLEPQTIVERTTAGRKAARKSGKYSSGRYVTYGYDKSENKYYKKNVKEAKVVQQVFNKYLMLNNEEQNGNKYTMKDLLHDINSLDTNGKQFTHQTIYKIIEKPVYAKLIYKNDVSI